MSEQKKEVVDVKNNTTKIIVSVLTIVIVFLLGMSIGKNKTTDTSVEEEVINEVVAEDTNTSLVAEDGLIHPKAPGPWATGAVKNLSPESFVVGENTVSADVKGLFVEGVGMLKIYDNLTEVFSAEVKAIPETDWVNDFVAIEPVKVMIPESLKGKTLIVRFMAPDVSGSGEMRYFGQTVSVK